MKHTSGPSFSQLDLHRCSSMTKSSGSTAGILGTKVIGRGSGQVTA